MEKKEELSKYIRKKLKEDYTKEEIKAMLLNAGWKEEDVAEAFMFFESKKSKAMTTTQKIVYVVVALIVIFGVVSILLYSPKLQAAKTAQKVVVIKEEPVKTFEETREEQQKAAEAFAERERIRQEVLNDPSVPPEDVGKEIVRRMREQG